MKSYNSINVIFMSYFWKFDITMSIALIHKTIYYTDSQIALSCTLNGLH